MNFIENMMKSSATFFMEKIKRNKSESCLEFVNYSDNIRTKRLFNKQIKEIHDEEEDESFKILEE